MAEGVGFEPTVPKFDLSESCQKKTHFLEFFYFGETHKTIVNIGGRGGIRTHGSLATTSDFESDAFNHSATLPIAFKQALAQYVSSGSYFGKVKTHDNSLTKTKLNLV